MRARGRRAVVLAGIAAGMVLVLGLLYWKGFLVRYHLILLRADPSRLRAVVLEPEGSLARVGLRLYLETEEGKDRLARAYFDACEAWCEAGIPPGARGEKWTVVFQVEGVLCVVRADGLVWTDKRRGNERERFIRSAAPFLAPLRGRSFRPERNPEFQVTFLTADEVKGGAISTYYVELGPPVGVSKEALAAIKAATALLIEPVTTSP